MRKLLFIFLSMCLIKVSVAQTVTYGIKAGFNLATLRRNPGGYNDTYLPAVNAGGILNVDFQNFFLQTGLFYNMKGERSTIMIGNTYDQNFRPVSAKTVLDYIEVPMNVFYKTSAGTATTMHFGGGPYIGYGFSSAIHTNMPVPGPLAFAFQNPDYGVNFIAGVTLKDKIVIDAAYQLGLANVSGLSYFKLRSSVISISAGYLFK